MNRTSPFRTLLPVVLLVCSSACAALLPNGSSREVKTAVPVRTDNRTALSLTDSDLVYSVLRGHLCLNQNDMQCASAAFAQALERDPDSPDLLFTAAHTATMTGDLQLAERLCQRALHLTPDDLEARRLLARLYISRNKPDEALVQYRILADAHPEDEETVMTLAVLYAELEQYDAAIRSIQDYMATHPDSAVSHLYLGNIHARRGEPSQAMRCYRQALDLAPRLEAARTRLAALYEKEEQYYRAITCYRLLADQYPEREHYRDKLAFLHIQVGNLQEALSQYRRILAHHRGPADDLLVKIGLVRYELGRYAAAVNAFRRAVDENPDNTRAPYYLATALEKTGQTDEALEHFAAVPPDAALFVDASLHRAYLLHQGGETETAVSVLQTAITEKPEEAALYRFLSSLLEDSEDYRAAIDALQKALTLNPDDEDMLFYLGVLYDKADMHEQSIRAMHRVLSINERNAEAMNFIGYTWAERGIRLDEAEKLIRKALGIKPGDGYITDSLGWVYYKRGQYRKAVKALQKAHEIAPGDQLIAEHLADACVQVNETTQAIRLYREILKSNPDKQDVLRKLESIGGTHPAP